MIYYDQDSSDSRIRLTSPASLFSAVEAAAGGSLNYKHSENFVERMARVCDVHFQPRLFLITFISI